jgi:hypothetical protein
MPKGVYARPARPIRVEGEVAFITLTQGMETQVDTADLDRLKEHRWCALRLGHHIYASAWIGGRNVRLHRFLLAPPGGIMVDHIDGAGLNNTRANLRLATNQQNQFNRPVGRNNTSGFKGVSWCQNNKAWKASMSIGGKQLYLGHYKVLEDAGEAYRVAAERHHGAFAHYP